MRSSSANFVLIHCEQVTCRHSSNLGRSLMPNVCAQNTHLVAMGLEIFDDIEVDVDSDCNGNRKDKHKLVEQLVSERFKFVLRTQNLLSSQTALNKLKIRYPYNLSAR